MLSDDNDSDKIEMTNIQTRSILHSVSISDEEFDIGVNSSRSDIIIESEDHLELEHGMNVKNGVNSPANRNGYSEVNLDDDISKHGKG